MLIYIQEVIWMEDQGEGTSLRCTLYFSYFRTSFSFSLWLGEWDHFTRRTETFQMISNMYSYFFVHTLHCMGFQWVPGEKDDEIVSTGCGPPSVLRLLLHMQGIVPVDFRRAFCPLEGGAQTYWHQAYSSSPWHCLGHSQGFLQCHFSCCKVVLCLEDDVLYQVQCVDQGLCSVFIKGVDPPWGDLCVLWHPSEDVDLAHRRVLCHFQAKWVISRTGQSSICERIHLTDDTPLCMRHRNSIRMAMQRFNIYEFAIIGRERL